MPSISYRCRTDELTIHHLISLVKNDPHFEFSAIDKQRMGKIGECLENAGILKVRNNNMDWVQCPKYDLCNGHGRVFDVSGNFFVDCDECGLQPLTDLDYLKVWVFDIEAFLSLISCELGLNNVRKLAIKLPDKDFWLLGTKQNNPVYFSFDKAGEDGFYILPSLIQTHALDNVISLEELVKFENNRLSIDKKGFNSLDKQERLKFDLVSGAVFIDGEPRGCLKPKSVPYCFLQALWNDKGKVVSHIRIKRHVKIHAKSVADQPPPNFSSSCKLRTLKLIPELSEFIIAGRDDSGEHGYTLQF